MKQRFTAKNLGIELLLCVVLYLIGTVFLVIIKPHVVVFMLFGFLLGLSARKIRMKLKLGDM